MNGRLDGCLIVSCCDDSTDGLVKEIIDCPSVSPVDVSEGVQAFPWAVETKYYTATIYLHTTSASVVDYDDSAENIHGLIVLFNPNQKGTLEQADKWIKKCHCDVMLLVCGRCPSAAEPQVSELVKQFCSLKISGWGKAPSYIAVHQHIVEPYNTVCHENYGNLLLTFYSRLSRQQVLEWCVERSCELIETQPSDEDDEEDATGVRRIVEALHAHPWPQLEMKDEVPGPSRAGNRHSRLSSGDSGEASTDLKLFSEAMAKDGDDVSFEELFVKFKDMKVQADKLSGEERKKFAEKVAIQFWKAFGGEEDEICGLSSEDEAEK